MRRPVRAVAALAVGVPLAGAALVAAGMQVASAAPLDGHGATLMVTPILEGATLTHTFTGPSGPVTQALTGPDDLTAMGGALFVAFQNGVGPQGEPSKSGNTASTIVELTRQGRVVHQWDVVGHCDGLTADRAGGFLLATVNEDANSSLYTIDPTSGTVTHYAYSQNPLPHNGGTDALSVYHGQILVSASAPGTPTTANPNPPPAPNPAYPAVYTVSLDATHDVATVRPLFFDETTATVANVSHDGQTQRLMLTDPDSNAVVPRTSPRFAGDFMLDSQGDQQQVYVHGVGSRHVGLSVLNLSQAVDDTAWVTNPDGTLFATNPSHDEVDAVHGSFSWGTAFEAVTPCDANSAPATCSTPNYLGALNPWTGNIAAVSTTGAAFAPKGLLFLGPREGDGGHGQAATGTATT